MDRLGERVAKGLFPHDGQSNLRELAAEGVASNSHLAYLQSLVAVGRFNIRPRLKEIKAPTLVIAGERDGTVPMEAKTDLHQRIPNSQLVVLSDSGHASPYDATARFNELLVTFLLEM